MNAPVHLQDLAFGASPAASATYPYDRYLRLGAISLGLLVIGIGGWAALTDINGAVMAPGTVVVQDRAKAVQHLDGGIIRDILVRDGDVVAEGDILLRLDPTALQANQDLVRTRLFETQARIARLQAERDGLREVVFPADLLTSDDTAIAAAIRGQSELFDARRVATDGIVSQLNQRLAQFRDQIAGLNALIASKRSQIDLISQELAGLQTLLEKGFVSKTRILAMQRERARLEGDTSNHFAEISRIENSMGETEVQILQIRRDRQAEVLAELRDAQTEASDQREQLATASDQFARVEIRSPASGTIHDLAFTTIGGVIQPGEVILSVIPDGEDLIVQSQVATADIDQIYPGQPTTVRLSAFNQRSTPELNGTVQRAAADRLIDEVTGMPYYDVRIEIPSEELARLDGLTLRPGMPAEAYMQTQARSVLSYVLKPATDAMSRTFREE